MDYLFYFFPPLFVCFQNESRTFSRSLLVLGICFQIISSAFGIVSINLVFKVLACPPVKAAGKNSKLIMGGIIYSEGDSQFRVSILFFLWADEEPPWLPDPFEQLTTR